MRFSKYFKIFGMGFILAISGCNLNKPELPRLGDLPGFSLTNQDNQAITLDNYRGKVWVANFIFTSCAGTCPMLTRRMKTVQEAIHTYSQSSDHPDSLQIVSFSVDPERDTPQELKAYAKNHGVDTQYWNFLTGPLDQVENTVVQGFKISMGKVPQPDSKQALSEAEKFDVVHGEKFVLIDSSGQIRGYYASEGPDIKKLIVDMKHLLKEAS